MALKYFVFGKGLAQQNESRLNDAGSPRAIENLIRSKNGRLQPRRDYETIAMTGTGGTGGGGSLANLRLYDLAEYNGRLLGLGRADFQSMRVHANDATEDVFDLLERPTGNWRRAPRGELPAGTQARLVGRIGRKPNSITTLDVAAGGGLVCMVYDVQAELGISSDFTIGVHIFNPTTDETVFIGGIGVAGVSPAERGRVVCVNSVFFIAHVVVGTNAINLLRFNPASDTALVSLTSPVAAGAAITAWDMSPGNDTETFWIAVARTGPTTALRGLNSAGVVTYTAAGPAVLFDGISILDQVTAGTERMHVAGIVNGTLAVNLHTYLPPATVPALSTLAGFGDLPNSITQLGISMDPDDPNFLYLTGRPNSAGLVGVVSRGTNIVTHAVNGFMECRNSEHNSKTFVVRNRLLVGAMVQEELGFFTHVMLRISDAITSLAAFRPVAVFDRFLGHQLTPYHLPQIAHDSSTGLTYMAVSTEDADRSCSPQILEVKIGGADRRQTVQLGDVLYIAGSVVMAYDGRNTQEAGGFLARPFLPALAGAAGGALNLLGTYQVIAVHESRDSKNRRAQSAPGNLRQLTLAGVNNAIQIVNAIPALTFRGPGNFSDTVTPRQLHVTPNLVFYRTLNANNGNGTFHLDVSLSSVQIQIHDAQSGSLIQSDVNLSDNEILYTQGSRGALSGPLEFVCPDAAGSLCASADRILTGQLINDTQIQESRPLFPGEQVQWNDTAGFFRDIRNRILAVARLDERRIAFTAAELFELDGPGVDDNGLGEIGAPRRLPSDVGIYSRVNPALAWRSMVEMSAGIMFQGTRDQIYLLPRGGVTPVPIGQQVEDTLDLYPDISAAVYMPEDQTVRFCCNNEAGTESIILLFDIRFGEWFVEGPYAFTIRSAARAAGRFYVLTSLNTLLRQRTSDTPLVFVPFAHRSSPVHGSSPGMFYEFDAAWIYGTYLGNFQVRCVVTFDERDTETSEWVSVIGRTAGSQFVHRFAFDQRKCESCMIDFEVRAFQSEAVRGPHLTYWAVEGEPSKVVNEVGPGDMT